MRKFLLFACCAFLLNSRAQKINIVNTSLDTNLAYMYFEADNILKVSGLKTSDKVTVTSTSGEVSSQGGLKFFLVPKILKKDTLRVFKGGKEVFQKTFILIPAPKYRVMVGSSTETTQTVEEILASPELFPCIPKGNYMEFAKETIGGYKMQVLYKNKSKSDVLEHKNNGKLGPAEQKIVKALKPGDKIEFTAIVFYKGDKKIDMGKQVFTIK